jgi:hypothetical protein
MSQPPSELQPCYTDSCDSISVSTSDGSGYSYTPGCVIFVLHVPPDTSNTALRAGFSPLPADDDHDDASTT